MVLNAWHDVHIEQHHHNAGSLCACQQDSYVNVVMVASSAM